MTEIDIYTDCSGQQTNFGIAVLTVVYNGLKSTETKYAEALTIHDMSDVLNAPISAKSNNISTGEMFALLKGLSLLDPNTKCKINIYTDNLYSFNLLNKQLTVKQKGCPMLKKMIQLFDFYKQTMDIEVMWIKGHAGTWGNEIVDKLSYGERTKNSTGKRARKVRKILDAGDYCQSLR